MLKIEGLLKKYGKRIILNSFNYTFKDNGFYIIKGRSGSGKTTLLNIISKQIKYNSGNVIYPDSVKNIYKDITYINQDSNLFEELTFSKNIELINNIQSNTIDNTTIDNFLIKLNIIELKDRIVSTLSKGEKQRLSIAIALLNDSKIILADEITSALDNDNKKIIINLLYELSQDRLVILSTHDDTIINKYNEYIINFDNLNEYQYSVNNKEICRKDKKYSLNLKNRIMIYKNIIHKQKLRQLYSYVLFTLIMIFLSFSINLNNINKNKIIENDIKNNDISYILTNNINKSNLVSYENNLYNVSNGILLSQLNNSQIYDFYVINTLVLDDSLNDNEIILTDYSISQIRGYNIINFENIDEIVGKTIKISNIDVTIKDIINTDYLIQNNDYIFNNLECFYSIGYISTTLYKQIFNDFIDNNIYYLKLDNININDILNTIFNNDGDIIYKNYNNINNEIKTIENIKKSLYIISIVLIIISIILTAYIVYIMYLSNIRNIRLLYIYGVNNLSIYLLFLIEFLLPLITSFILSTLTNLIIGYIINTNLLNYVHIDLFNIASIILTFIIMITIISLSNTLTIFKRNK